MDIAIDKLILKSYVSVPEKLQDTSIDELDYQIRLIEEQLAILDLENKQIEEKESNLLKNLRFSPCKVEKKQKVQSPISDSGKFESFENIELEENDQEMYSMKSSDIDLGSVATSQTSSSSSSEYSEEGCEACQKPPVLDEEGGLNSLLKCVLAPECNPSEKRLKEIEDLPLKVKERQNSFSTAASSSISHPQGESASPTSPVDWCDAMDAQNDLSSKVKSCLQFGLKNTLYKRTKSIQEEESKINADKDKSPSPPKKVTFSKPSKQERLDYKLALRMAKQVTEQRFKKGGKIPLLYPVVECIDWGLKKNQTEFITIGSSTNQSYKSVIKKAHQIYSERLIGSQAKTEFLLSYEKLHNLIDDVKFIRKNYKEIKKISKKTKKQQ